MAFLDLYSLRGVKRQVGGGGGGDLTDLTNKVNSLSNIAIKNNISNQSIPNLLITTMGTNNNDVANKLYVDDKFNYLEIVSWSGNFKTTNLTWQQSGNTLWSTGTWGVIVEIKWNNIKHFINWTFKISDLTHKYTSGVHMFFWSNSNSANITSFPSSGVEVIYDNQNIRLIKAGQDLPTATTEVKIRRVKLW